VRRFGAWLAFLALVVGFCVFWYDRVHPAPPPPPFPREMAALIARRNQLQDQMRSALVAAGEKGLAKAPRAGIMIGLPTSLTRSVADQIVTGLFGETTIVLRNIKVHHEDDVHAKLLLTRRHLGDFVLDLNIQEAEAHIRPSAPQLTFGDGRINVSMPFELVKGFGKTHFAFQWDSKMLASNMVCGDVSVERDIGGSVRPGRYQASGGFAISTDGGSLLLRPDFPDLAVRIYVEPSEDAWKFVDDVIEDQKAVCKSVLKKVDLKGILARLLGEKGINIKIPPKIFKPVRLPAGLQQSLDVHGIKLGVEIKPSAMVISGERIWYGADVKAHATRPAPAR
jgi:hypothetical protein